MSIDLDLDAGTGDELADDYDDADEPVEAGSEENDSGDEPVDEDGGEDDEVALSGEGEGGEEESSEKEGEDAEPPAPTLLEGEELATVRDRKVTIKVNGEEMEVPLSEAIDNYQLRKASQRAMQEAAESVKRKEGERAEIEGKLNDTLNTMEGWIQELANPDMFISNIRSLGPLYERSFIEAANQLLAEQIEDERLSPAERELRAIKRRDQQRQAETQRQQQENARKAEAEKKKKAEAEEAARQQFSGWAMSAMNEAGFKEGDELWDDASELFVARAKRMASKGIFVDEEACKKLAKGVAERLKPPAPPVKEPPPAKPPGEVTEGARRRKVKKTRARQPTVTEFFSSMRRSLE